MSKMNLVRAHDPETVKGHYINVIDNAPEIDKTARRVYGKHSVSVLTLGSLTGPGFFL